MLEFISKMRKMSMKKLKEAALVAVGMSLLIGLGMLAGSISSQLSKSDQTLITRMGLDIPQPPMNQRAKITVTPENVVLTSKNMVALTDVVYDKTVEKAIRELSAISSDMSKNGTIYLVLDTPGGSIEDGQRLVDAIKSLPQTVTPVVLFAASMGFEITQQLAGDRLIAPNGVLMSHRARGGEQGQYNGELDSRLRFSQELIAQLDMIASARMGLSMEAYHQLILNEYWVRGINAIVDKAADKIANIRCNSSLEGFRTEQELIDIGGAGFGSMIKLFAVFKFAKCPLISSPVEFDIIAKPLYEPKFSMPNMMRGMGMMQKSEGMEQATVSFTQENQDKIAQYRHYQNLLHTNKAQFVEEYIVTGKFREFIGK